MDGSTLDATPSVSPIAMEAAPYTIVVDTREQRPFDFSPPFRQTQTAKPMRIKQCVGTLHSGDYSLLGHETAIAVERKSVPDLYGSLGKGRDRFEREIARLNEMKFAAVVVEGDWLAIFAEISLKKAMVEKEKLEIAMRHFCEAIAKIDARDDWIKYGRALEQHHALEKKIEEWQSQVTRSKLSPHSVYASVLAWQQRYQCVHWYMMPTREWARQATIRILDRYFRDLERKKTADAAKN